jgi:hypothetical protein
MALLKRASRVLMKPSERGDWMSAELEGNGHGWTNGRRATASVAAALVSLLAFSASAGAATYTPNTTADGPAVSADCPPDATPTAACSLRDAVEAANGTPANDEIVLEGKRYELDPSDEQGLFVSAATGVSSGSGTLLIRGTSARDTIIDGNSNSELGLRPITYQPSANGELRDLSVTGGNGDNCGNDCSGDLTGGGILVRDGSSDEDADAQLLLTRVRVFDNGADRNGGAIQNDGKLTLVQSLVDGNVAGVDGGGIENADELTLTNTTISGNKALGHDFSQTAFTAQNLGDGGGIHNSGRSAEDPETFLTGDPIPAEDPFSRAENSTIAFNEAHGNGGGVATDTFKSGTEQQTTNYVAIARFHNTIVSDNKADGDTNCTGNQPAGSGTGTSSEGHNLEDGDSCLFTASGDLDKASKLGALADNGGGTNTHALAADSAAVNAAESDGCPAVDQRGTARPQDGACDIGAFERVPDPKQEQPQQQIPQQETPKAKEPSCLDTLPPITELHHDGLRVTSTGVTLSGTSRDQAPPCVSGVDRVEVSMAKVSGTDLNCRFLRRSTTFLLSPFMNCRQPIRFIAAGTSQWSFRFKVKLPPGQYRAQARGYDEERNKETPKKHRNIVTFTVR